MAERGDPHFLEVGVGELGQKLRLDLVLDKAGGVLAQTEPVEPLRNIFRHCFF